MAKHAGLCAAFAVAAFFSGNCSNRNELEECAVRYTVRDGNNSGPNNKFTYAGEHTKKECEQLNALLLLLPPIDNNGNNSGNDDNNGIPQEGDYMRLDLYGNCKFTKSYFTNGKLHYRHSFHVFQHYAHGERKEETFDRDGRRATLHTYDFDSGDRQEAKDTIGTVNYDRCARGLIH